MAKGNKPAEVVPGAIDFGDYLPKGFSADDTKKTGGFPPTYRPKSCWDPNTKEPVVGYLLSWEQMPDTKKGESWFAIPLELTGPANVEDIDGNVRRGEAGEIVMMPVTGALKSNSQLRAACCDPNRVHIGIFRILGQKDTGEASLMWDFEVLIHNQSIERKGAHALYNGPEPVRQLGSGREQTAST